MVSLMTIFIAQRALRGSYHRRCVMLRADCCRRCAWEFGHVASLKVSQRRDGKSIAAFRRDATVLWFRSAAWEPRFAAIVLWMFFNTLAADRSTAICYLFRCGH